MSDVSIITRDNIVITYDDIVPAFVNTPIQPVLFPFSFRPHKLKLLILGGGGYDENGDWTPNTGIYMPPVACRYEPNGRAQTIVLPDGTNYEYHYTVYLNPNVGISPQYGDTIELIDQQGLSIGEYTVKGVHLYQLGMRIWV